MTDPAPSAVAAGALLHRRGWQVAIAESCTGGALAAALSDVPGSSTWLWGGVVSYTRAAKQRLLDVPTDLIERHGMVSEPVAVAMAEGALRISGANVAVSVTGIAGPGGGEVLQPVGTVWFTWLLDSPTSDGFRHTAVHVFGGDRAAVRRRAVGVALDGLVELLAGAPQ